MVYFILVGYLFYFHHLFILLASKHDSWLAVDAITGQKLYAFSSQDGLEATCPINEKNHKVLHIPIIGE